MKEVILGGMAIAAVGGGVYYFPSDTGSGTSIYSMTEGDAITKLADAPIPVGYGPFPGGDIETMLPENGVVEWGVADSDGEALCRAEVSSEGKGKIRVTSYCNGGSSQMSAVNDVASELKNAEFREFVDAILTGRPYDRAKMRNASIGTVLTNMPKMQSDAARMQHEFSKMESEEEEDYVSEAADFGTPSSELASEE